ncbi:RING finger protein 32 [Didymosphaeria variabile]|uniref:RING finger protein 32 n=1 Tax=Didymosphaeria variabile TaxID=1932322 RepID=A0A9W8XU99_9PLEO|nr:RING finger protein 32 [Didymosphaeria variabile]KAJ4358273.1 RING finger protein 32 [Didymosphaeria variabile]
MASPHTQASITEFMRLAEAIGLDLSCPTPTDQTSTLEDLKAELHDHMAQIRSRLSDLEPRVEANATVITAVPIATRASHQDEAEDQCGICHEELFCVTQVAIKLKSCGHTSHRDCLIKAFEFRSKDTCPYCRQEVLQRTATTDVSELDTSVIEGLVDHLGLRDNQVRSSVEGVAGGDDYESVNPTKSYAHQHMGLSMYLDVDLFDGHARRESGVAEYDCLHPVAATAVSVAGHVTADVNAVADGSDAMIDEGRRLHVQDGLRA